VAYAVKFLAALLYRFNFSWSETWAAGALLSSRLSLIIAASAIALELGIIGQATNSSIVLVAIVTCTLSPILFNRLLPPQQMPVRRGVILAGQGELAILLAERLRQAGEQVTLIGRDPERIREVRRRRLSIVEGEASDPAVLERAGAASAQALVALTSRDQVNLAACRLAEQRFGVPQRVAVVGDPLLASEITNQETRVVQPQLATALALEGALHFPAAFDMLADHTDGVEMREGTLNHLPLDGRRLSRIELPGDVLVVGLRRGDDLLVPHGETVLRQGDRLMLVGHPDQLQQAMAWLCPSC
jgi:Trk K+ transport system NAD-binding subunit